MTSGAIHRICLSPNDCPISLNREYEILSGNSTKIQPLIGKRLLRINGADPPESVRSAERLLSSGIELELVKGRVPVALLSGFLGSGKTTLLNKILKKNNELEEPQRIAIIVNDMSTINIDADLIERREEEMIEIHSGCICCTLRDDLIKGLVSIINNKSPDYIIIESTGVGEVLPLAVTFSTGIDQDSKSALRNITVLDNMVTLLDASSFSDFFNVDNPTDVESCSGSNSISSNLVDLLCSQITYSNTVVITKLDLVEDSSHTIDAAKSLILFLNPSAIIITADHGNVSLKNILNTNLYKESAYANTKQWKDEQSSVHVPELEHYGITSFAYEVVGSESKPFNSDKLKQLLNDENFFKGVLRAKGCLWQSDNVNTRWNFHITPGKKISLTSESRWRCVERNRLLTLGDHISGQALALLQSVEEQIEILKERNVWSDLSGDKRIELVFIGRPDEGFDESSIRLRLEDTLTQ